MTQLKRTSRRRWKAKIRLGQWVPAVAMVEHKLWDFQPIKPGRDWPFWIPLPDIPPWDREFDRDRVRSNVVLFRNDMERRAWRIMSEVRYES